MREMRKTVLERKLVRNKKKWAGLAKGEVRAARAMRKDVRRWEGNQKRPNSVCPALESPHYSKARSRRVPSPVASGAMNCCRRPIEDLQSSPMLKAAQSLS